MIESILAWTFLVPAIFTWDPGWAIAAGVFAVASRIGDLKKV